MSIGLGATQLLHRPSIASGNRPLQDGDADVHGTRRVRRHVGRMHRFGRADHVCSHEFAVRHGFGRLRRCPELRDVPCRPDLLQPRRRWEQVRNHSVRANDVRCPRRHLRFGARWLRQHPHLRQMRHGADVRRRGQAQPLRLYPVDMRRARRQLRLGARWLWRNAQVRQVPQWPAVRCRGSSEPVRLLPDDVRSPRRQLRFGARWLRRDAQLRHVPRGRDLRRRGNPEPVRLRPDDVRGPR